MQLSLLLYITNVVSSYASAVNVSEQTGLGPDMLMNGVAGLQLLTQLVDCTLFGDVHYLTHCCPSNNKNGSKQALTTTLVSPSLKNFAMGFRETRQ